LSYVESPTHTQNCLQHLTSIYTTLQPKTLRTRTNVTLHTEPTRLQHYVHTTQHYTGTYTRATLHTQNHTYSPPMEHTLDVRTVPTYPREPYLRHQPYILHSTPTHQQSLTQTLSLQHTFHCNPTRPALHATSYTNHPHYLTTPCNHRIPHKTTPTYHCTPSHCHTNNNPIPSHRNPYYTTEHRTLRNYIHELPRDPTYKEQEHPTTPDKTRATTENRSPTCELPYETRPLHPLRRITHCTPTTP